jgi:hypothetical protein
MHFRSIGGCRKLLLRGLSQLGFLTLADFGTQMMQPDARRVGRQPPFAGLFLSLRYHDRAGAWSPKAQTLSIWCRDHTRLGL